MNENTVHDDKLFEILKDCKNLPTFLNSVFGFLKRRTDFYCITTEPNSPVGLPAGIAEQCVKEIFDQWKLLDSKTHSCSNEIIDQDLVPPAIREVVIESTDRMQPTDKIKPSVQIKPTPTAFTSSESYNGAVFENYTWSQSITDIDIIIKVPTNVKSKDVHVEILPQNITVKLKGNDAILLNGDFCEKVKHQEAIWALDQQKLEIHLDKVTEFWWNCLVTQEPTIDINNIDCSRPYEDLSEEAQAKIEELSWNQERKRLGLPTSDELILQNKLKKAWTAEGSPFKDPFDPNNVVFQH